MVADILTRRPYTKKLLTTLQENTFSGASFLKKLLALGSPEKENN